MRNGPSSNRIALGSYPIRTKPGVALACSLKRSCGSSAPGRVAHWARTNGATMGNRELPDEFGNALAIWAKGAGVSRVIFESTGIYHRSVEMGLAYITAYDREQIGFIQEQDKLVKKPVSGNQLLGVLRQILPDLGK